MFYWDSLNIIFTWRYISSFVFYIFVTLVPFAVWSWKYSSPRGVRLKCHYAFFLVCFGCDTSYIVSVHIQCQAYIQLYTFVVLRAFMADAASQAGDTDSSWKPLVCRGPWMSTVVLYCWCHSDGTSVLSYFTLDICIIQWISMYLCIPDVRSGALE